MLWDVMRLEDMLAVHVSCSDGRVVKASVSIAVDSGLILNLVNQ